MASALALLWLALPLGAAIHGAVETHQYCVEHNAFEHVADGHDAAASEDLRISASATGAHELCAFGDACFRDGVTLAPAGVRAADPLHEVERPAPLRVAAILRSVLSTAPKTSPPLA